MEKDFTSLEFQEQIEEICVLLCIEYYDLEEDTKEAINDLLGVVWEGAYDEALTNATDGPEDAFPDEFGN